jgi:3-deoxy-D-arabino-heptulosonate 7-phosphate (DAHP) synthase class II
MSRLGGVSLEFTGEFNEEGYSVTECLGGSMELSEEELGLRYQVRIMTCIILRVNFLTYLTHHYHLLRDLRVSATPV